MWKGWTHCKALLGIKKERSQGCFPHGRMGQGDHPNENYVAEFCGPCHVVGFDDIALRTFFIMDLLNPFVLAYLGGKLIGLWLGSGLG